MVLYKFCVIIIIIIVVIYSKFSIKRFRELNSLRVDQMTSPWLDWPQDSVGELSRYKQNSDNTLHECTWSSIALSNADTALRLAAFPCKWNSETLPPASTDAQTRITLVSKRENVSHLTTDTC